MFMCACVREKLGKFSILRQNLNESKRMREIDDFKLLQLTHYTLILI